MARVWAEGQISQDQVFPLPQKEVKVWRFHEESPSNGTLACLVCTQGLIHTGSEQANPLLLACEHCHLQQQVQIFVCIAPARPVWIGPETEKGVFQ